MSFPFGSRGEDVLRHPANRAFIGTPDRLGLLRDGRLLVLAPSRKAVAYAIGPGDAETEVPADPEMLADAVAYYQGADCLLRRHLYDAE